MSHMCNLYLEYKDYGSLVLMIVSTYAGLVQFHYMLLKYFSQQHRVFDLQSGQTNDCVSKSRRRKKLINTEKHDKN
jgi:hypothetical protein